MEPVHDCYPAKEPTNCFLFFRYIHHFIDPDDPPLNKQLPKPEHSYQTVGCIFNHRAFYANCQVLNCYSDLSVTFCHRRHTGK